MRRSGIRINYYVGQRRDGVGEAKTLRGLRGPAVSRQIIGHDIEGSLEHLDLVAPIGQIDSDGMNQNEERRASFSGSNGMNAGAGRLRSSSFIPARDHPNFAPMMEELQRIFTEYKQEDRVHLEYTTHIYFGRLNSPVATRDWNLA